VLILGRDVAEQRKVEPWARVRCGQGLRSGNHGVAASRCCRPTQRAKKTIAIRIDITDAQPRSFETHGDGGAAVAGRPQHRPGAHLRYDMIKDDPYGVWIVPIVTDVKVAGPLALEAAVGGLVAIRPESRLVMSL